MNLTNNYIPPFVPQDLKWYERNGLMTWYDQTKCKEFLKNLDNHFENMKIINCDIINKKAKGEEIPQSTLKTYLTIPKKKPVYEYPPEEREKVVSAGFRSTLKRNDVFVSKDLVKYHFLSPINGEKLFLSFMKKRQFEKKSKEKKGVVLEKILIISLRNIL